MTPKITGIIEIKVNRNASCSIYNFYCCRFHTLPFRPDPLACFFITVKKTHSCRWFTKMETGTFFFIYCSFIAKIISVWQYWFCNIIMFAKKTVEKEFLINPFFHHPPRHPLPDKDTKEKESYDTNYYG